MRKYETHEGIDRKQALESLLSGDSAKIEQAFIALAYNDRDPDWVAGKLLKYTDHADLRIRASAIHCLFLLSRVRGSLNAASAYDVVLENLEVTDEATQEATKELLYEIVQKSRARNPVPLDEIAKTLSDGNELQKLAAVAGLFLHDEPRGKIEELEKVVMGQAEPVVRAWCLVEVRSFLLNEQGQLHRAYGDELIQLAQKNETPFIRRMIEDFQSWMSLSGSAASA